MAPPVKGPAPRDRLCANCLYFKPDEAPEVGECRLNPPEVLYDVEEGCFAVYPIVAAAEDWCGQHRGSQ